MYCSACGTQLAPGLSFCNRCGMNLKETAKSKLGPIAAFLTAITLIGTIGLGITLGGTLSLSTEAHLKDELLGFFMLFCFLIIALTEILLVTQLSRVIGEKKKAIEAPPQFTTPNEFRAAPQPRTLAEPVPSVTESTTRTLEYSRNEPDARKTAEH
jgi:hypothetical protein